MKYIFVEQNTPEPVKYNQYKSALINIYFLTRNVNIKRLNLALPGDKLSTNFSKLRIH